MRQTISGLVAAIAVVTVSAVPAMACGFSSCVQPQVYVAPVAPVFGYSGCNTGCGWARERLPDPVQQYYPAQQYPLQQYYYVNQGPTYTGPGNWAPLPVYREGAVYQRPYYGNTYRAYRQWRPRTSYYHAPRVNRYGYAPRYGYAARHAYAPRYAPAPYYQGQRALRRYY